MKTLETILRRPLAAGIYYVGIIAVFLLIYSIYSIAERREQIGFAINALPLNFAFTVFSLALTLLPSVALRLFSFDILWRKVGHRAAITAVLVIGETLGMMFTLNLYMGALIGGGVGSLELVMVSLLNCVGVFFWGVVYTGLWVATKYRKELPPIDQDETHYPNS